MADPNAQTPVERDPLRLVTMALLALMVAAVVGLTWYLVSYVQSQRLTNECYQGSFGSLQSSLQVSREAARSDRIELRDLISSISDPAKTPAERRKALEDYVTAIDQSEQARALAPLPARTCG